MPADPQKHHGRKIAVVGLGYVGLPVAVAFARAGERVVAFDVSADRIAELRSGCDRTREVDPDELRHPGFEFTADPDALHAADFFIVAVPTPIDEANRPDLRALLAASRTVGGALKKGDIVVYESTVYPGATEEDCAPILEAVSGLVSGRDGGRLRPRTRGGLGPRQRARLHGGILARADQSGRQRASV